MLYAVGVNCLRNGAVSNGVGLEVLTACVAEAGFPVFALQVGENSNVVAVVFIA